MPAKPRKVKFNPKKHKKWDPEKHLDRRKKQSGELYGGFLKVSMNELAEMKQPLPEVERPSGFRKIGDQYKYIDLTIFKDRRKKPYKYKKK